MLSPVSPVSLYRPLFSLNFGCDWLMLKRKSLINLDCLFAPKQHILRKQYPIDIIDSMLSTERTKKRPARFGLYVMDDQSTSTCPHCAQYVESDGVVCIKCNAWWHFECAGVSQEILNREWYSFSM